MVMVTVPPAQIDGDGGEATMGKGFTVIVTVVVSTQPPDWSVPITWYVVVTLGLAVTELPVEALNDAAGDQTYVAAPVAVMVEDCPTQISGGDDDASTVMEPVAPTTTESVALLHPDASVT